MVEVEDEDEDEDKNEDEEQQEADDVCAPASSSPFSPPFPTPPSLLPRRKPPLLRGGTG